MKISIIGPVALVVYVNLVPYACRIWRGLDWVTQYLPDEEHRIGGLLFFGGFASLVAIPLIGALLLRRWIPITFIVSVIFATVLLSFCHHNYDLASDAQAAIGLIFIPIYTAMITGVTAGVIGVIEFLVKKRKAVANKPPETPPSP